VKSFFVFVMLTLGTVNALALVGFVAESPRTLLAAPDPEIRIDINTATIDELLKVPGMTRTWAARIIRYRPYRAKSDLLDRGVVSSEVYDRIKNYIIAHRAKG
jgi:DNA uptake protein ComE-like DNA-binding protein